MQCVTVKKGVECAYMNNKGCQFNGGRCQPVVEACEGCAKTVVSEEGTFCLVAPNPAKKWAAGPCNFATHYKAEVVEQTQKLNPAQGFQTGSRKKEVGPLKGKPPLSTRIKNIRGRRHDAATEQAWYVRISSQRGPSVPWLSVFGEGPCEQGVPPPLYRCAQQASVFKGNCTEPLLDRRGVIRVHQRPCRAVGKAPSMPQAKP